MAIGMEGSTLSGRLIPTSQWKSQRPAWTGQQSSSSQLLVHLSCSRSLLPSLCNLASLFIGCPVCAQYSPCWWQHSRLPQECSAWHTAWCFMALYGHEMWYSSF